MFSVEAWQTLRMGLFNEKLTETQETLYAKNLTKILRDSKQLWDCQHRTKLISAPPQLKILNIIGNSSPTYSQMRWNYKDNASKLLLTTAKSTAGDGTITCVSAQLPEAWTTIEFSIKGVPCEHTKFFHSKETLNLMVEFIR